MRLNHYRAKRFEVGDERLVSSLQQREEEVVQTCEKCRYFRIEFVEGPTPGDRLVGHCHRFPPTKGRRIPFKQERVAPRLSDFPLLRASDWCGEHAPQVLAETTRASGTLQKADQPAQQIVLSCREAAKLLRISDRTLYTLSKNGQVPRLKIGSRVCYRVETLRKWLEQQELAGNVSGST